MPERLSFFVSLLIDLGGGTTGRYAHDINQFEEWTMPKDVNTMTPVEQMRYWIDLVSKDEAEVVIEESEGSTVMRFKRKD